MELYSYFISIEAILLRPSFPLGKTQNSQFPSPQNLPSPALSSIHTPHCTAWGPPSSHLTRFTGPPLWQYLFLLLCCASFCLLLAYCINLLLNGINIFVGYLDLIKHPNKVNHYFFLSCELWFLRLITCVVSAWWYFNSAILIVNFI